jgi:hypothetical protein
VTRSWEIHRNDTVSPSRSLLFGNASGGRLWY